MRDRTERKRSYLSYSHWRRSVWPPPPKVTRAEKRAQKQKPKGTSRRKSDGNG